ncbi:hypothetical protein LCGC14_1311430 [marine sediment metagenome]|uniref:Uncharacterized protein n=1 Tax=marine sediment metagenome TaxID=412755 RepID=A0A0F9L7A5_9ZZZZ
MKNILDLLSALSFKISNIKMGKGQKSVAPTKRISQKTFIKMTQIKMPKNR